MSTWAIPLQCYVAYTLLPDCLLQYYLLTWLSFLPWSVPFRTNVGWLAARTANRSYSSSKFAWSSNMAVSSEPKRIANLDNDLVTNGRTVISSMRRIPSSSTAMTLWASTDVSFFLAGSALCITSTARGLCVLNAISCWCSLLALMARGSGRRAATATSAIIANVRSLVATATTHAHFLCSLKFHAKVKELRVCYTCTPWQSSQQSWL